MTDNDPNEADATGPEPAARSPVNKITWAQVGRVTEPGRYMFKFGWLTITADDLAIWQKYLTAAFTLHSTSVATAPETDDMRKRQRNLAWAFSSCEPIPTIRK
jgi:hypothetical protein